MIKNVKSNRYSYKNANEEVSVRLIAEDRLPAFLLSNSTDGYGLFLSRKKHTEIKTSTGRMELGRYQGIVFRLADIEPAAVYDGICMLAISGTLAERYINEDLFGRVLTLSASDDIFAVLKTLEKDISHQLPPKQTAKLAFAVLMDLFMYEEKPEALPRLVSDTIDIIQEEYAYLEGVDDLADRVGVTKSHLIRVFHTHMNTTPGRYLEAFRITQAKAFLASGEMSIEVAAGLCGYAGRNYFGKVFKRVTGMTPKAYVKSNQTIKQKSDYKLPDDIYV